MIEISGEFTSIAAGFDSIEGLAHDAARDPRSADTPRIPTGARVTLEFCRETALAPAQRVRALYDFAGDGHVREATGVAQPTRTVVRCGRAVVFHYRLSHWIDRSDVMSFVTDDLRTATARRLTAARSSFEAVSPPSREIAAEALEPHLG